MLQDRCPANCSSMKVESPFMYVWWKYYSVHVTLKDLADKDVLDVTRKTMKCHGDRNDPDKQKGFRTAVWCIHKAHEQTGTHIPSCEVSCLVPEDEWFKGCDNHKVTHLFFKVEIQLMTMYSLKAWTRYSLIVKSTEGNQLNNWYHTMSGRNMTAFCQAILSLTCKHL